VKNILVPLSGGKDSTATLLLALDKQKDYPNINVIAVFNDTGWEHPITYEYIDYLKGVLPVDIYVTKGADRQDGQKASTLSELIIAQGKFPFGRGRFCTSHLKQRALRNFYRDNIYDKNKQWWFWYGMRSDESNDRGKKYGDIVPACNFDMNEFFPSIYNKKLRETITVKLPIVTWSRFDVFSFIESKGIKYNPLYDEGTNDRVGCYPCMLSSEKVQQKMFSTEVGQQRLVEIKRLEKITGSKYEMYDTDQGSCEICKI